MGGVILRRCLAQGHLDNICTRLESNFLLSVRGFERKGEGILKKGLLKMCCMTIFGREKCSHREGREKNHLNMGITVHALGQSLLEGICSVTLIFIHVKSCRNKESLRDNCLLFSLLHNCPVAA